MEMRLAFLKKTSDSIDLNLNKPQDYAIVKDV